MNDCMYRSETRSEFCRWTWIDVVQLSLNFSVYLAGYDLSAKRQYRPSTEDIASCADAKLAHLIQVLLQIRYLEVASNCILVAL